MAETLAGTSVKDAVIRMIQGLPDDCTLADIEYHLAVRRNVEEALKDVEEGRVYTQDEVERMSAEWLKSSGPPQA